MIAQTDKGKTALIIYKDGYSEKIHTFLTDNEIHTFQKNPIKKDQKHIQENLQKSNPVFNKQHHKPNKISQGSNKTLD
jgi:hypothetical protein